MQQTVGCQNADVVVVAGQHECTFCFQAHVNDRQWSSDDARFSEIPRHQPVHSNTASPGVNSDIWMSSVKARWFLLEKNNESERLHMKNQ